jgi:uncharacterized protein
MVTMTAIGPKLPGFSGRARWLGPVPTWTPLGTDGVEMVAPPRSDRFHDPADDARKADSPLWAVEAEAPSHLVARVTVDSTDKFDAGVLMAYQSPHVWAKLCFERDPIGRLMVVSVVTRGRSDDANAFVVDGSTVWLRVSLLPRAYAFHASTDGRRWEFVRYFRLGAVGRPRLGLSAQAPVGEGCTVRFEHVRLGSGVVDELRGGA